MLILNVRLKVGLLMVAVAVLTQAGCSDESVVAASERHIGKPSTRPLDTAEPKARAQNNLFEGVIDSHSRSWEGYVDTLDVEEREHLTRIAQRYLGTPLFDDMIARRQLQSLGFPLPEEWLAAKKLSDAELRSLASTGDRKAALFLTDRLLDAMQRITEASGANNYLEVVNALPEAQREPVDLRRREALTLAATNLSTDPTPFSAYQYGIATAAGTENHAPVLASIQVAGELGDIRADRILEQYRLSHSGKDAEGVASFLDAMRRLAQIRSP